MGSSTHIHRVAVLHPVDALKRQLPGLDIWVGGRLARTRKPEPCMASVEAGCGHRQRAHEPPALVLADEPTGNPDTENTRIVYRLFREINEELGTAFIIVTHDRSEAQQTDSTLEISDGVLLQNVRNEYATPRG